MTRHEQRLTAFVLDEIRNKTLETAIEHLFSLGLLSHRTCEVRAICAETERLTRQGVPRCEAMEITAQTFCCSYEKVRGAVYNKN